MTYLQNCWYLAAWLDEVPVGGRFGRTIAEKPLLLWREGEGQVSALLDRCPHRFAPLSRGRIEEGRLTCGYHGVAFDRQGRCVANPHGPITSALSVPGFPVALRHEGIWVWLGDADRADPELIADLGLMARLPSTAQNFGYEQIAASYLLCSDNILDLSHADYLHPDSLGGGATTRATQRVREDEREIVVSWFAEDDVTPPALAALTPDLGDRSDVHIEVRWSPPGVMQINFGAARRDRPDLGADTWGIHIMVPKDARSTHYFHWTGRNARQDDAEFNAFVREMLTRAFAGEDKPMLEAQQVSIGDADFESLRPALLRTDEGSMRMRRRMRRMIAEEQDGAVRAS